MGVSIAELLCRLFGHRPGYKVKSGLYAKYQDGKKVAHSTKVKTVEACIRCGKEKKEWK